MMSDPTLEEKAKEAEADPATVTVAARTQGAATEPSCYAESAAPMNTLPHDAPKARRWQRMHYWKPSYIPHH